MTMQPRLHIVKIKTVEASFSDLYQNCADKARLHLARSQFSLAALWDYAQYLDLADAGYSKKTDSMYAMVTARCRTMLSTHGHSAAVRELCGRTCSLSNMLNDDLNRETDEGITGFSIDFPGARAAA